MIDAALASFCVEREPLAPYTWYRLGGPARVLANATSAEQLAAVLAWAGREGLPVYPLGAGANVLVSDDGVDGVVVRLAGGEFHDVHWLADGAVAGGGVDVGKLALRAVRRGLAGLECMAGIPGTVGGCVRMNAGGRFGEIGDVVRRVWTVDRSGCRREWERRELGFGYRCSALGDHIVERVEFVLTPTDSEALRARYDGIWAAKTSSQPLGTGSAGCVFKNPPGDSAGRLIDRAGCKGLAYGGARVSPVHANFIVASGGAAAADVLRLIAIVRKRVREQCGVELELEVKLWGDDGDVAEVGPLLETGASH